jgi:hypothetical protein
MRVGAAAWALVALLVLPGFARAARAQDELSPGERADRLAKARRVVEDELNATRDAGDPDLERLRRAASTLTKTRVRAAGSREGIDTDPRMQEDLERVESETTATGREEKLSVLAKRLSALEREARRAAEKHPGAAHAPAAGTSELERPDPAPGAPETSKPDASRRVDPEKARAILERVLDAPRYKKRTAIESEGLGIGEKIDSWLQRIENAWIRFMQPSPSAPTPAWLTWLKMFFAAILPSTIWGYLGWVAGIVGLIILLFWLRWKRRSQTAASALADDGPTVTGPGRAVAVAEDSFSEDHWRREARLLAQRGDYRGAIRALYTGVLLLLQRAGRLKFDKGKTNWEHVRELRRNDKPLASSLEPLTRTFDVVWYGQKPIEPGAFDAFLAEADAFSALVGAPRAEPTA